MAARINTKFVILLVIGMLFLGGGAAALYYFAVYRDPDRYVTRGDASFARGDFEDAVEQYGRAYGLEKNTQRKIELLMQLAETHKQVSEEQSVEATRRLNKVIGCWVQVREYDSGHQQATANLLSLLYEQSRSTAGNLAAWDRIFNTCDNALAVLPDMALARKFRGIAQTMRMGQTDIEQTARQKALEDMQTAAQSMPEDIDLPYYLALWHVVEGEYQKRLARDDNAKPLREQALQISLDAVDKHPRNAEIRANHINLLMSLARATRDESLIQQAAGELDELEKLVDPVADDSKLAMRVAGLINALDREVVDLADGGKAPRGMYRAEKLLREVAEHHPEDLQVLVTLGNLLQERGQNDDAMKFFAEAHKDRLIKINADVHRFQFYQAQATYHLADLALDKCNSVKIKDQKAQWRNQAVAYRNTLAERLPGHGLVDLTDGKLAMLDGNHHEAVKRLDAANRQFSNRNADALQLCAMALVRLGETGAAVQRLEQLIQTPQGRRQVKAYLDLSRLKLAHHETEDALRYVNAVLKSFPALTQARVLKSDILVQQALPLKDEEPQRYRTMLGEAAKLLEQTTETDDRSVVFQRARITGLLGSNQQAIDMITDYHRNHPNDLLALQHLLRLMVANGQKEQALAILEKARQAQPEQKLLDVMARSLTGKREESVTQVRELLESVDDPLERELKLYAYYQQLGDTEQAEKHLALAIKADPKQEDERLLRTRFNRAMESKDWAEAQRIVDRVSRMNEGAGLDQAEGRYWQGRLLLARGNYRQAASVFDQAVQEMPINSQGWILLGDARQRTEDFIGAQAAYRQALEFKPGSVDALRRLIQISIQLNQPEQAMKLIDRLRLLRPNDAVVYQMYLGYMGRYGDARQALRLRLRLAESNPENQANRRAIAGLHVRLNEPDKARKVLEELLNDSPGDLSNLIAMAEYLYRTNDFVAGRKLLLEYLHGKGDQASATDWIAYANFLRLARQNDEAKAAYRKAIELEDGDLRAASRELADWLFNGEEFGEAAELYHSVLSASTEKDDKVWRRYIDALINGEQYDQAAAQIKQFLGANERDYQITMLEARLAERTDRLDEAGRLFDQAVALAPNNTTTYIQRARFRFGQESLRPQVIDDLNKVIQLAPTKVLPREMLVRWHLTRRDESAAIEELQRLIGVAPRYASARVQLANLLLSRRYLAQLNPLLDESERLFPNVPVWNQLRARMFTMQNRREDAVQRLADAYRLNKTSQNALAYIEGLLSINETEQAEKLLRDYPQQVAETCEFQSLKARLLHLQGQSDLAGRSFELAVDLAKSNRGSIQFLLRNALAVLTIDEQERFFREKRDADKSGILEIAFYQLWLNTGEEEKIDRAISGFRSLHRRQPENNLALRTLALACHQTGRTDEAVRYYLAILEKLPEDLTVLNNLAFLYADDLDQAEKALPLARQAVEVAGNDPLQRANVLDTLGWVLYRANRSAEAIQKLKESISLYSMKDNHLHLAQVYLEQGMHSQAREELSQAREYAEKNKDKAALDKINSLQEQLDASVAAGVER